jgi:HicB family
MDVNHHVEALLSDLAAAAGLGDDHVAQAAERLSHALRSSAGLRLLDVLGEAALEISAQLPSGQVEVRLAGQQPSLIYVESEAEAAPPSGDDAFSARITLRLPESLKASLEAAASREGVSLNTYLVRALSRAPLTWSQRGPGSRLTGFAQS